MTEATATLVDGMQFVIETGSGHAFAIDSTPEVGGRDSGPHPFELLAAGVAGCTGMDVISILRKMQQKVAGLRVQGGLCHESPAGLELRPVVAAGIWHAARLRRLGDEEGPAGWPGHLPLYLGLGLEVAAAHLVLEGAP